MPIRVLHIVQQLSRGGASRALVATAACASRSGASVNRVVSLCAVDAPSQRLADDAGIPVISRPTAHVLDHEVREADIVQVHYWNTPELVEFMRGMSEPARLLLWSHVAGDTPPHLLHRQLIEWADVTVASGPYSMMLPVFRELDDETRRERTDMIVASPDFSRLRSLAPKPHVTFNVGYIGTVDPVKMHPQYVRMSAAVNPPDIRFVVCGSGNGFPALRQQAADHGASDRFDFRGYVEDIAAVLSELDVFGYPVCHCSTELVLQEAMFAGVPPVIFATGGAQFTVRHGDTGLVVSGVEEYSAAIEHLYRDPKERQRLGTSAAAYARRVFGADRAADAMHAAYERMMTKPKRPRSWPFPPVDRHTRPSAAWTFLDLLGETAARPFTISLTSTDQDDALEAEAAIAGLPALMLDAAGGGVLHYRRHFPEDPHLRLWSGLALRAQGRLALAVAEFEAARRLGLDHWRVSWYTAQTATAAGAHELAAAALERVVRAAPEFVPGLEALAAVRGAA